MDLALSDEQVMIRDAAAGVLADRYGRRFLFAIGLAGVVTKRNALIVFMCIELMLNAANLTFVSYARALNDISGQVIVFFTLVVAAAEVAVGLAIIVAIFRRRQNVTADDVNLLKG